MKPVRSRFFVAIIFVGGLLWCAKSGIASRQAAEPARPPIQIDIKRGTVAEQIQAEIGKRAGEGSSGAIIVEKDGAIVLESGFGWANREAHTPFTLDTIAQIGSLTKQFTATAIVDLSARGKLQLTDPLSRYFPQGPEAADDITIEQLLTHTSGLPDDCGSDFDLLSRKELVTRCLAKVMPSQKGKFRYSNLGYSVLAAIIEKVSAEKYEDYLRERFFQPLGMNHTGYFFDTSQHKDLAWGYVDSMAQPPISDRLAAMGDSFWNLKGNGGVQSTVREMYRWYRALTQDGKISDSIRRQLMTVHARRDDNAGYGYGWFVRTRADGEVEQVSHTGSDGVFYAAFVWRPEERTFFYLVTNTGEKRGAEIASATLRTLRAGA